MVVLTGSYKEKQKGNGNIPKEKYKKIDKEKLSTSKEGEIAVSKVGSNQFL